MPATSGRELRALDEVTERLGVGYGDVQEVVVGAGQEEDVDDLVAPTDLSDEVPDLPPRVRLQTHRDHRPQCPTHRGRVDVGEEATDDTEFHEPPDPSVTGRRGDADALGELAVGHASVGAQETDQRTVDVVEVDRARGPNIVR